MVSYLCGVLIAEAFYNPQAIPLAMVLAFAVSMYPLGFMLGSSCSPCCGSDPCFTRPGAGSCNISSGTTLRLTVSGIPSAANTEQAANWNKMNGGWCLKKCAGTAQYNSTDLVLQYNSNDNIVSVSNGSGVNGANYIRVQHQCCFEQTECEIGAFNEAFWRVLLFTDGDENYLQIDFFVFENFTLTPRTPYAVLKQKLGSGGYTCGDLLSDEGMTFETIPESTPWGSNVPLSITLKKESCLSSIRAVRDPLRPPFNLNFDGACKWWCNPGYTAGTQICPTVATITIALVSDSDYECVLPYRRVLGLGFDGVTPPNMGAGKIIPGEYTLTYWSQVTGAFLFLPTVQNFKGLPALCVFAHRAEGYTGNHRDSRTAGYFPPYYYMSRFVAGGSSTKTESDAVIWSVYCSPGYTPRGSGSPVGTTPYPGLTPEINLFNFSQPFYHIGSFTKEIGEPVGAVSLGPVDIPYTRCYEFISNPTSIADWETGNFIYKNATYSFNISIT